MGTSAGSIKLQVKKELEAERKAAALAETYSAPKEVVLDGAPMLAVSGVYFKCPLVGDEVKFNINYAYLYIHGRAYSLSNW